MGLAIPVGARPEALAADWVTGWLEGVTAARAQLERPPSLRSGEEAAE